MYMIINFPPTDSVIFDNKNAFLRNKKVYYNVLISVPTRDLNIIDGPTEDSKPAACTANL